MAARRPKTLVLCAVALACLGLLTGCGKVSNKPGETVREGLSTPLDGLRYTVFLTRQLNLRNEEDSGYLPGYQEAAPGHGLFGVFLEACNKGHHPAPTATSFYIEDAQGNRFTPQQLPANRYPFAFQQGVTVPPKNCMPVRGSLAQLGPTSGALLLFDLPLANTENRPLLLHIENPGSGTPPEATVTLDI